ncbi:hypothetical protein ACFQOY_02440 [Enterococcus alcedinis]|uniref:hypothetical protein n=1 Tax=Enterococcus alcedinis TaxID=1274384 RepID=UPI00360F1EF5
MYKKMFIGVAGILFLIFVLNYFNQANKISDNINQEAGEVEVTGKINNQEEALAALAVLEKNLQAANDEDLDLYVSTLVPSAREATKKKWPPFLRSMTLNIRY